MNIEIEKLCDKVLSIRLNDSGEGADLDAMKTLIADHIFDANCTIILVSMYALIDILSDDAKDFCDLLRDERNHDVLITKHHYLMQTLTFDGIDYIITSVYNVPKHVVRDLITSAKFIWGNAYLIRSENIIDEISNDLATDIEVLSKSTLLQIPDIKCELLVTTNDGCELLWFNPSITVKYTL